MTGLPGRNKAPESVTKSSEEDGYKRKKGDGRRSAIIALVASLCTAVVLGIVFVGVTLYLQENADKKTEWVSWIRRAGKIDIHESVLIEESGKTVLMVSAEAHKISEENSMALHDFNTGNVALRDFKMNVCFITKIINPDFNSVKTMLESRQGQILGLQPLRIAEAENRNMTTAELGPILSKFCDGIPTHWLNFTREITKRETRHRSENTGPLRTTRDLFELESVRDLNEQIGRQLANTSRLRAEQYLLESEGMGEYRPRPDGPFPCPIITCIYGPFLIRGPGIFDASKHLTAEITKQKRQTRRRSANTDRLMTAHDLFESEAMRNFVMDTPIFRLGDEELRVLLEGLSLPDGVVPGLLLPDELVPVWALPDGPPTGWPRPDGPLPGWPRPGCLPVPCLCVRPIFDRLMTARDFFESGAMRLIVKDTPILRLEYGEFRDILHDLSLPDGLVAAFPLPHELVPGWPQPDEPPPDWPQPDGPPPGWPRPIGPPPGWPIPGCPPVPCVCSVDFR